jgi:hypothetical protein
VGQHVLGMELGSATGIFVAFEAGVGYGFGPDTANGTSLGLGAHLSFGYRSQ